MAVTLCTFVQVSVCILEISVWIDVYSVLPTWFRPPQLWSLLFVTLSAGRHHVTIAPPTLLSPATSVNPVKHFRHFMRRVEQCRSFARSFVFASLSVSSRWSASSPLVAVVVSQRLIRLINETMLGPQIACARSSRTKSEQCHYCSHTFAASQPNTYSTILYFEKFNGRSS